jgi:mannose-1-phosphate guanylyltransferase/mannose-6-phosphate isomerase
MAGGAGTRLWPLSRKNFPKQFLSLINGESFIQITARRLSHFTKPGDIYVVAGEEYQFTIKDQLSGVCGQSFDNLILEPMGKNTAPAIALTIKYLLEKKQAKPDEILFFSPSDHIIKPENDFSQAVLDCLEAAKDNIVTFGIVPAKPETGYGYIELGNEKGNKIYPVSRFVEKPDLEKAKSYLQAGNYVWNAGMFLFSIQVMLKAFQEFAPELYEMITKGTYEEAVQNYQKLSGISIDYAVMEKTKNIVCKKTGVEWNDVGSWDSIYEILPKDANQNVVMGDVETYQVKNSLIISNEKLTALIGLSDIAVIETEDAILISDRKKAQDVKEIVTVLKNKNRKEVNEHTTTYRPWGHYTVLEESDRYKIKKIVVNQGAKLSLQRHAHRSEHWVVVKGTALVRLEDKEFPIHENESAYIPKSAVHRLSNPGRMPLEIIEVQNGEYVGEDDIERLEDNYGRA